ncbi:MAG: glycosyltransferase [Candidatus Pacearchaeota archaeon]
MKTSLIATVLNEEKNIEKFLNSILKQTKKPNEIIIVDGESKDKTYKILKEYVKKNKKLKIFQKEGANIAQGRNIAIKKAKNSLIVGVDAGTKYEKDWLENLIEGFEKLEADMGFGKTLPLIENNFQKVLAKKMRQQFGSSRNIIFKKEVWKKVGGYPEDLRMAEDTVFNEKVKNQGFKIIQIPKAVGYWEMRINISELKKQFYNYGYWDAVAYKKYKILPTHHKIAVIGLSILSLLYPLLWMASQISLSIKIDFVRRFAYLKGFWEGILGK